MTTDATEMQSLVHRQEAATRLSRKMLMRLRIEMQDDEESFTASVQSIPHEVVVLSAQQLHDAGWVCQYGICRPYRRYDHPIRAMSVMTREGYLRRQRELLSTDIATPFIHAGFGMVPIALLAAYTHWYWTALFVVLAVFGLAARVYRRRKAALPEKIDAIALPQGPMRVEIAYGSWPPVNV